MRKRKKTGRMSLLIMKLVPSFRGFKIGFETLRLWIRIRCRSRRRRRRRRRSRVRHQSNTIAVEATVIAVIHHLHRRNFIKNKTQSSKRTKRKITDEENTISHNRWLSVVRQKLKVYGGVNGGDKGPTAAGLRKGGVWAVLDLRRRRKKRVERNGNGFSYFG